MKHACLLVAVWTGLAAPTTALDLTEVPRTIGAEPEYEGTPRYGLLVFGPEAATRVWLVHDGPTLYADLNGDGNLTDPAERFAMHELSQPNDGVYLFEIDDVRGGDLLHKGLKVGTMNLMPLAAAQPELLVELLKNPKARCYGLSVDVEIPGRRGAGIDGRIHHMVAPADMNGLSLFADSSANAPIYHMGGDWEITLFKPATLTVGRDSEVYLALGTPGLGPGTTAYAAYEKLVPAGKFPKVEVTLPGASEPLDYALRQRCCTINFHGGVRLPDDAAPGEALVKVSFPDWLEGFARPTTHKMRIVKPRYEITLEPVSTRLKATLVHPSRDGVLVDVNWSPDGSRIIAGDRPGGMIQQWDVETGEPLTLIETGYEERNPWNYYRVSPDWQTIYAPRSVRDYQRVERGGKQRMNWVFDAEIRRYDLESGASLPSLRQSPTRSISGVSVSPDGRYLLLSNELPGEYDGPPERRASLYDVAAESFRDLSGTRYFFGEFSNDASMVAIGDADDRYGRAINLYATATGEQTLSIPIEEKFAQVNVQGISQDGKTVVALLHVYPGEDNYDSRQSLLKFWDTTTGELTATIAGEGADVLGGQSAFSSDGCLYAVPTWRNEPAKVYLANVNQGALVRAIELADKGHVRRPVFSPDGRWLVVVTQTFPENRRVNLTAVDLPQPRIHLIETATGEVRETIVGPQDIPTAMAFSPDGQTLATAGEGRVHLWDLSTPPGK